MASDVRVIPAALVHARIGDDRRRGIGIVYDHARHAVGHVASASVGGHGERIVAITRAEVIHVESEGLATVGAGSQVGRVAKRTDLDRVHIEARRAAG